MTVTIIDMVKVKTPVEGTVLAQQLVAKGRADGVDLVGRGGFLNGLTKRVAKTALEAEMVEHLGYAHGDWDAKTGGNERNGTRAKTAQAEIGPMQVEGPRGRDAWFDPAMVNKVANQTMTIDPEITDPIAQALKQLSGH